YLGWVARERGEYEGGEAALERSRALLAQLADPWERSEVMLPLTGATTEAEVLTAREVLSLKRELGDAIATSDSLNNVGWEDLHAGEVDRAIVSLEEALAIARDLEDRFRITLALCNLGLAAVLQNRCVEAVESLRDALVIAIRSSDVRCGSEAVLGLAAAEAGLGEDEASVKLDAVRRKIMSDAGIVYDAWMLELLEPYLSQARTRLGPERIAELEAAVDAPTLELALDLLDESHL
ncbi:MAG TPA: hypothetical protein VKB70_06035, partial [Gaiellaceae bacterium]|nr:hypothetical protein [Gaiellaceae bacterium]